MRLKRQFKNKLTHTISIMCSLYISYLIYRVYNLGILGICTTFIFLTMVSRYLTYLFNKNIAYEKMEKKNLRILGIIAVVIAVVILVSNFNFFTKSFEGTSIEIYAKDNENLNENLIKYVCVNNVVYTINGNNIINNGVLVEDTNINVQKVDNKLIKIEFPKSYNIELVFNKQDEPILLKDGDIEKEIRTNDKKVHINSAGIDTTDDIDFKYTVTSNIKEGSFYTIKIIVSLFVLSYITYMTILIFVYNCKKENKFFIATLVIAIIGMWYYFNYYARAIQMNDSPTYIQFAFSKLLHLEIQGRTPVYPIIIRICQFLFGSEYLQFLIILQYVLWYVSIIYCYKTLELVAKNKICISLFTILYALCPAIILWNNMVLTESIALSCTMIFLYYIIKYIKQPTFLSGSIAIIIAFILTFHRPTAIIYVLFLEIFWVARFIFERRHIKIDLKCFILSTITILFIGIYGLLFYRTFGFFSISNVTVRQDLFVCIREEYYKNSDDKQFAEDIEKSIKEKPIWNTIEDIQNKYDILEIKKFSDDCKKKNMSNYIKHIVDLCEDHAQIDFEGYSIRIDDTNMQMTIRKLFTFIAFIHVYIIIVVEFVWLIYRWIEDKKVPWIHCGLFAFPFVIVFSSFIGTCAEYMRTAICVLPFIYVTIAIGVNKLLSYGKNKE